MLQATPFDLCLFTGGGILPADDLDPQRRHTRDLFTWCSQQINNTNRRLQMNPALRSCRLALPMTEELFDALLDTPSWQEVRGRAALHQHKALVLRFLLSSNQQGGSPILHLAQDNTHFYNVIAPKDFFASGLSAKLQDSWSETSGTCIFGNAQTLEPAEVADISACWIISPGRGQRPNRIEIQAQPIESGSMSENKAAPMLSTPFTCPDEIEQIDFWPWEQCVRQALWQDERLPFYGPDGSFGFRPNVNLGWQPGQRPATILGQVHGYLDDFGGIWQWESGRAALNTPFAGHWNVQLAGSVFSAWENHLSDCLHQRIRLRSNHVNIEANGSIVDDTFDRL
jgi:hypothetical protein